MIIDKLQKILLEEPLKWNSPWRTRHKAILKAIEDSDDGLTVDEIVEKTGISKFTVFTDMIAINSKYMNNKFIFDPKTGKNTIKKFLKEENLPTNIWDGIISSERDITLFIDMIANDQDKYAGGVIHITNKLETDQNEIESIPIIKMAPGEQTDILGVYRTLIGVLEYNLRILGKLQITITNS